MLERGSAIAVALIMMLAGGPPAAAAMVTINTKLQGDAVDIHASAMLNADASTAWHVLTDYDHYAEFVPDLRLSRVIAREGNTLTVGSTYVLRGKISLRVIARLTGELCADISSNRIAVHALQFSPPPS